MKDQPKYFKMEHTKGCFYWEVHRDHIVGINWTEAKPLLFVHHRCEMDPDELPGEDITKKYGIPITKEEFQARLRRATECNNLEIM